MGHISSCRLIFNKLVAIGLVQHLPLPILPLFQVVGTGRFEVSILAYFNESGRMAGESCCSGSRDNDTCLSLCPTFLTVCLQHHSAFIPEFPACTYGHAVTPVFNRSLTDDVKPTKNMYFIKIPFQFSWPVSIYVFKSKTRYLIK